MSEFSLINTHFKSATKSHPNTILGIGDDCAISAIPSDCDLVTCIDTLVAGRHFVFETCPHAIGYKSVAVNLSDLAAMGATPYAILLGLSLPENNKNWLKKFSAGIQQICQEFNIELIGGDTTKSDILTISITALGFVKKGQAIKRAGAKIGEVICVSGNIGTASFALHQILDDLNGGGHIKDKNALNELNPELKSALQYPTPKVELGKQLIGYANSMIDISDGLAQDLGHILKTSQVGAKLYLQNIPHHTLLNSLSDKEKYQHILSGGDDYELCFTMAKEKFNEFNLNYPDTIFNIGEIVSGNELELFLNDKKVEFEIKGWEHF